MKKPDNTSRLHKLQDFFVMLLILWAVSFAVFLFTNPTSVFSMWMFIGELISSFVFSIPYTVIGYMVFRFAVSRYTYNKEKFLKTCGVVSIIIVAMQAISYFN